VLELLSEFPHTASFSAHTHMNAIYHLGPEYGYRYRGPNAAAPERQTAEGQAKAGGHKHVADADDGQDGHEHAHGHGREHEHGQGHGQGREYEREQEQGHEREQGHQHGVHVHHNVGTSSGTWWKGPLDSRGIPMTTMRDGTPNGYAIATFDGPRMTVRWKAAHHEEDYQMNIFVADSVAADDLANERGTVMVNVFNGQPGSAVEMRVRGHSEWTSLDHQLRFDPHYVRQQQIDQATPMQGTKRLNEPRKSTHIWVGKLPPSLPAGTHLVEVRAEDAYGQVFVDRRPFRVR
jgi:hypothetical protein